jgi:hypothetical protein
MADALKPKRKRKRKPNSWETALQSKVTITAGIVTIAAIVIGGIFHYGTYLLEHRAYVELSGIEGVQLPLSPEVLMLTLQRQDYIEIPYTYTFENKGSTDAK